MEKIKLVCKIYKNSFKEVKGPNVKKNTVSFEDYIEKYLYIVKIGKGFLK